MIDLIRDLDPLAESRPLPASAWTAEALLDVIDHGGRQTVEPLSRPTLRVWSLLGIATAVLVAVAAVAGAVLLVPRPDASVEPAAVTRAPTTDELTRITAIQTAWNSGDLAQFEDSFVPAWLVGEGMDLDDRIAYHERFVATGGAYDFGDCSVIVVTDRIRCSGVLTDRLLTAHGVRYQTVFFFLLDPSGKIVSARPTAWAIYPEQGIEWLRFTEWLDEHHPGTEDPVTHLDEYLSGLES